MHDRLLRQSYRLPFVQLWSWCVFAVYPFPLCRLCRRYIEQRKQLRSDGVELVHNAVVLSGLNFEENKFSNALVAEPVIGVQVRLCQGASHSVGSEINRNPNLSG